MIKRIFDTIIWGSVAFPCVGLGIVFYYRFFTEYIFKSHPIWDWTLMIIFAIFGMSQVLFGGIVGSFATIRHLIYGDMEI